MKSLYPPPFHPSFLKVSDLHVSVFLATCLIWGRNKDAASLQRATSTAGSWNVDTGLRLGFMRGVSQVSARSSCVTHSVCVLHSLATGEPSASWLFVFIFILVLGNTAFLLKCLTSLIYLSDPFGLSIFHPTWIVGVSTFPDVLFSPRKETRFLLMYWEKNSVIPSLSYTFIYWCVADVCIQYLVWP